MKRLPRGSLRESMSNGNYSEMSKKEFSMRPKWAIWWYSFHAVYVAAMMLNAILPNWSWFIVYASFLIPEIMGIATPSPVVKTTGGIKVKGDTLSESVWSVIQGKLSMKIFACFYAGSLVFNGWHLFDIVAQYTNTVYSWQDRLPWDFFMIGMGFWLVIHVWYLGKHG